MRRLIRRDPQIGEPLQELSGLRIADWLHIGRSDTTLFDDFDGSYPTPARFMFSIVASVEVYRFGLRQQLCEIILVRLAEIPEIVPSPRHVGTDMKDYDTLIEGMTGRILSYGSHNTPNELHEGAQVGEDATYHGDSQIGMIEAFA